MIGGSIYWSESKNKYDTTYSNPTGYVKIELDLFNLLKDKEGIRPSQFLINKNRSIDFIDNTYEDENGTRISLLLACKRYLENDNITRKEKLKFKNDWLQAYTLRKKIDDQKNDKSHIFFTKLLKVFNEQLNADLTRSPGVPPLKISKLEATGLLPDIHHRRKNRRNLTRSRSRSSRRSSSRRSSSSSTSSRRSRSTPRPKPGIKERQHIRSRSTSRSKPGIEKKQHIRSRSTSRPRPEI